MQVNIPISEMCVADYVAAGPNLPRDAENTVLPSMPDIELDFILSHTNTELKCALLGLLHTTRRRPDEVYDELVERGATDIHPVRRNDIKKALGNLSKTLVNADEHEGIALTPIGEVAQGIAGHNAKISRDLDIPLAIIIGQSMRKDILSKDGTPSLTHLPRLLVAATLGRFVPDVVTLAEIYPKLEELGANHKQISRYLDSWKPHNLVTVQKIDRRTTLIKPHEKLAELREKLGELVSGSTVRDPIFLVQGQNNLDELLDSRRLFSESIRRSFVGTGREMPPKIREIDEQAYKALVTADRPLNTRELREIIPEYHDKDVRAMGWILAKIARYPNTRIRRAYIGDRNTQYWSISAAS